MRKRVREEDPLLPEREGDAPIKRPRAFANPEKFRQEDPLLPEREGDAPIKRLRASANPEIPEKFRPHYDEYGVWHFLPTAAGSLSPEWFALRWSRITASRLAGAVGLSPYGTPEDMFWQMIQQPDHQVAANAAMREGSAEEWFAVQRFAHWTGFEVCESPYRTHERYPFLGLTPDILGRRRGPLDPGVPEWFLGECKMPHFLLYDYPPIYYVVQQFLQMSGYNMAENHLNCVCKITGGARIWHIEWSDRFWAYIIRRAIYFWRSLKNGSPPNSTVLPVTYYAATELLKKEYEFLQKQARERGVPLTQLPYELVNDEQRYEEMRAKIARQHDLQPLDLPPRFNYSFIRYDVDVRRPEYRKGRPRMLSANFRKFQPRMQQTHLRMMVEQLALQRVKIDVSQGLACTRIRHHLRKLLAREDTPAQQRETLLLLCLLHLPATGGGWGLSGINYCSFMYILEAFINPSLE